MTEDAHVELIASMVEASGRVRHPGLPIDRFLSVYAYDRLDDLDDLTNVPAAVIEAAQARRGAVIMAADQIIDACIGDLQEIDFDDEGMPDPDRADYSFVHRPPGTPCCSSRYSGAMRAMRAVVGRFLAIQLR